MMEKMDRNEELLMKMSEAVASSKMKEEIEYLTLRNLGDSYYGDKVSRLQKLAEALQRLCIKSK